MGSLPIWFFYYSLGLEKYSAYYKSCYYVVLSSVEKDESPNHTKQPQDVQDFTCKLVCQFCHGWWTWEMMNERSNKWNSKSHFLFEYWKWRICAIGRRRLLMHSTSWLHWRIWHGVEKSIWVLNLNEEPIEGNGVDDHPTPIVNLPQARDYAQLLSSLSILQSFEL